MMMKYDYENRVWQTRGKEKRQEPKEEQEKQVGDWGKGRGIQRELEMRLEISWADFFSNNFILKVGI